MRMLGALAALPTFELPTRPVTELLRDPPVVFEAAFNRTTVYSIVIVSGVELSVFELVIVSRGKVATVPEPVTATSARDPANPPECEVDNPADGVIESNDTNA